jgi:hypothetical protein
MVDSFWIDPLPQEPEDVNSGMVTPKSKHKKDPEVTRRLLFDAQLAEYEKAECSQGGTRGPLPEPKSAEPKKPEAGNLKSLKEFRMELKARADMLKSRYA